MVCPIIWSASFIGTFGPGRSDATRVPEQVNSGGLVGFDCSQATPDILR
jgi:hypothetical protein